MSISQSVSQLPHLAVAAHGGGKSIGPPRRLCGLPMEEPKDDDCPWFIRRRAIRDLLEAIVGEANFELALRLLVEGLTIREWAEELGVDPATAWRMKKRFKEQLEKLLVNGLRTIPPVSTDAAMPVARRKIVGFAASKLADAVLAEMIVHPRGCTMEPFAACSVRDDLWAVSLPGFDTWTRRLTFWTLHRYVMRWSDLLFVDTAERHHLGVWRRKNSFCLGLTRLFPDLPSALFFGAANKKDYATNVMTEQSVRIPQKWRRAA